jgi:hypothetical protein
MNKFALILMALVVVGLVMMPTKEKYIPAEVFGFAGHTKPRRGSVVLNDAPVGKDSYEEVEASVDNDIMNELVTKTNEEVSKRTGMCTHVIETTQLKKFQDKSGNTLYEVMFMMMKHGGFSYGFSVVSTMFWKKGKAVVASLRTQPLEVESPSNVAAFTGETTGEEFLDFKLVNESWSVAENELLQAKNKLA